MTFQHAFGQFTQATKCGLAQPIPAKWDKKKSPIGTSQQILWITHTQAVSIDGETLPKPVANPRSGLSFCGWGNPAWETLWKAHWSMDWPTMTHPITRLVKIDGLEVQKDPGESRITTITTCHNVSVFSLCRELWRLKDDQSWPQGTSLTDAESSRTWS